MAGRDLIKKTRHISVMSFLIQQFNCQPQFQYGNPPDSIPLWFAAREDNTLSSRLTRPSLFPSESFNFFNEYCHLAWDSTRLPNKKDTVSGVSFIWQLPILPGRFQPSTFGVCELNYRVRHGYGCILTAIATESLRVSVLSKLYRRKVFRRALATWSRL